MCECRGRSGGEDELVGARLDDGGVWMTSGGPIAVTVLDWVGTNCYIAKDVSNRLYIIRWLRVHTRKILSKR